LKYIRITLTQIILIIERNHILVAEYRSSNTPRIQNVFRIYNGLYLTQKHRTIVFTPLSLFVLFTNYEIAFPYVQRRIQDFFLGGGAPMKVNNFEK